MSPLGVFLPLCAGLALVASVAGCGGDPGHAVAQVDGESIEMQSFNHWLAVTAKSRGGPKSQVPKPPDYAACVNQKRNTQPAADAALKQQCKRDYDALRDQTLQLLISFRWIEGEAGDRGISVTDTEVEESFEEQKQRSFPEDADFQSFLESSGQTEQDVLARVRSDLLSSKIRDQVTKGQSQVSDEQIADYYRVNKARFSQPERRALQIVLTETEAKAKRAFAALAAGGSWKSVAMSYSSDRASKSQGGKLPAVARGEQPKTLDDAVFKAPTGNLSGPVKTQLGYYVFEVTKVTRASQQTLEQATPRIEQMLSSGSRQRAFDEFVSSFRKKWKERTECLEGYAISDCKNGPTSS
jgi:foldase protein PrsA